MCAAHTYRFPCTSVFDIICDRRWFRARQALLQLATTEAQVGRQGMYLSLLHAIHLCIRVHRQPEL